MRMCMIMLKQKGIHHVFEQITIHHVISKILKKRNNLFKSIVLCIIYVFNYNFEREIHSNRICIYAYHDHQKATEEKK